LQAGGQALTFSSGMAAAIGLLPARAVIVGPSDT
jgi:hypothetical protein